MSAYRKYFEPAYGEMAPETIIGEPEIMDLGDPARWRARFTPESAASILALIRPTCRYGALMSVRTTNTHIQHDGALLPVRIYHPDGPGTHPIVVFYHGGGFMMNDFTIYDYVTRYIAKYSGAVVVAVEYRLAPELKCPAGLEDCYATLEWAVDHAREFGGDPASVTVCGDSAGGNFAAAVALMARDRKGPKIHRQILIYPLVIFKPEARDQSEERYGKGYFLEYDSQLEPLACYFSDPATQMFDRYNSPLLNEDLSNLPDACILAAECDPLLDQGLMYAAKLEDHGTRVEYHLYTGMIHGFLNRAYGKTFDCLNAICSAVPKLA